MKNITKKLKIALLVCILVFALTGCGTAVDKLEPQPMPEYPQVESGVGYVVEGVATDTTGKPLGGVQLKIDGKIHAITDDSGYYKISGLEGSNKILPVFYDYEFTSGEFEVSKSIKFDLTGTNAKKYMITFDSYSNSNQATEVFGVVYEIGGKFYSGDDNSKAFMENLSGKTTITPHKDGFTFLPSSLDVYAGTNAKFTAVANSDRYSVSGDIDISSFDSDEYVSEVEIYLDGKLAGTSYTEYSYANGTEQRMMKYKIDGLDPAKAGGYQISYKIGGVDSIQKLSVSSHTTSADFKYYLTKEIDIKLSFSALGDLEELPAGYILDCDINVYDEDGTFIKRYSCRNLTKEGIVVWRGATVEVVGVYKEADYTDANGNTVYTELKEVEETDKISESDMRKDYINGNYFEIRVSPRTIRDKD